MLVMDHLAGGEKEATDLSGQWPAWLGCSRRQQRCHGKSVPWDESGMGRDETGAARRREQTAEHVCRRRTAAILDPGHPRRFLRSITWNMAGMALSTDS
jgi:hypothetical protein